MLSGILNVFSKKKPQQANMSTNSGAVYAAPKKTAAPAATPAWQDSYNKANPVANFGNQVVQGNGLKAIQNTVKTPTVPISKPNMSVAPNMTKAPQMSVDRPAPKPITEVSQPQQPQAPQQPQQQEQGFSMADFLSGQADRRAGEAQRQLDQESDFIKQQYGLANDQLRSQLPAAQQRFSQFKGDTEAMISDLIAGGQRQKDQTSDYYGDAQRQAAQTRRETQGQTQRTFANLGTLDSRGEGSFQQATENTDSEFNRFTQQTLKAKADKLSEIESAVRTGERQARQVITQEQAKLEDLAQKIEFAVANNSLSQARELTKAYNDTKNYIFDIEDSLAQAQYQFAAAQQQLQDEMTKMQSFTPEFMASGQPTNQQEYEFLVKNQKAMEGLYGGNQKSDKKQTEKQMAYNAAATIAQNALSKLNAGDVSTGLGSKLFGGIGEKLGTNSDQQQAYRSDIAAMRTAVQNALLGANMSPSEMDQVMAAIPQYDDAPNIAKSKLNSLITNLPIMAGNGQEIAQQLDTDQINQILASLGQ